MPYDNANTGGGTLGSEERPTLIGQLYPSGFQKSLSQWFNTSAITVIPFTYGNIGRNVLRQDSVKNVDFSIAKEFLNYGAPAYRVPGRVFQFVQSPEFCTSGRQLL